MMEELNSGMWNVGGLEMLNGGMKSEINDNSL